MIILSPRAFIAAAWLSAAAIAAWYAAHHPQVAAAAGVAVVGGVVAAVARLRANPAPVDGHLPDEADAELETEEATH